MSELPPPSNSHPIWKLLLSPLHSVQVTSWLGNPEHWEEAEKLRGEQDETILHWAALSDMTLLIQALGTLEISPNAPDKNGFSPMDWQINRQELLLNKYNNKEITKMNYIKSVMQADELISTLLGFEGVPNLHGLDLLASFAVKNGLWRTLATLIEKDKKYNCFYDGKLPLHHLILSFNTKSRISFLKELVEGVTHNGKNIKNPINSINDVTEDGKTVLFLTIEEIINRHTSAIDLIDLEVFLEALIAFNPDPSIPNKEGVSPAQLILLTENIPDGVKAMMLKNIEIIENSQNKT